MRAKLREVYALPVSHSQPERLGREPGPPGSSDLGTCASCGHSVMGSGWLSVYTPGCKEGAHYLLVLLFKSQVGGACKEPRIT